MTHTEGEYEKGSKTSVTFIALLAVFDVMWRECITNKLLKVIPCLKTCLINNLLTKKVYQVFTSDAKSTIIKLNNIVP